MIFQRSKNLIFIILLFFLTSLQLLQKVNAPYFQFDSVEHYSLKIDESVFINDSKNKDLIDLYEYLVGERINELKDTNQLSELIRLGYQKSILPSSKNADLNKLFSEKGKVIPIVMDCEPMYRDILVLKKKNKTIGIAKICFECGQSEFIGTSKKTDGFGKNGEFQKLKTLLSK
ncbi:MAG: hypothetical protein ACK46Y_01280 [Fluviicola sp.]